MLIWLCIATALGAIIVILSPFIRGEGGLLAPSAQENSAAKLDRVKVAILKRYVVDEMASQNGEISKRTWEERKKFLTNRYVDAAKRLDYLQHLQKGAKK